jgi:hypothetical protein
LVQTVLDLERAFEMRKQGLEDAGLSILVRAVLGPGRMDTDQEHPISLDEGGKPPAV